MARGTFSTANYFRITSGIITSTPLTIAAWVKPSAFSENQYIAGIVYSSAASGKAQDGWYLEINATDGKVNAIAGNGTGINLATSGSGATSGAWNHMAAKFTSSTSRHAYLNGTKSTESTNSNTPSATPDKTAIGVFVRENGSLVQAATACHIAEVGFWNVALSDAEVSQLAAGYSPLFVRAANLYYYKLFAGDSNGDELEDFGGSSMVEQGTVSNQTHPPIIYPKQWQVRTNQAVNRSTNY